MGSLYKPSIATYRMPDGSYYTPDGKRVKKDTPGAVREVHQSDIWYGKYKTADGRVERKPLYENKETSRQLLLKLESDELLAKHGVANPFKRNHDKALADHLEDYRRRLLVKGDCEEHVKKTIQRIAAIMERRKFLWISDIQASAVEECVAELRTEKDRPAIDPDQEWFSFKEVGALLGIKRSSVSVQIRRCRIKSVRKGRDCLLHRDDVQKLLAHRGKGRGISTSNGYLVAIKGFTKWLVKDRRTAHDPLAHLSKQNAAPDIRRRRRALSQAELALILLTAQQSSRVFRGLTGADRAALYLVAMTTGLRVSELAVLTPARLDLDGKPPVIFLRAGYTKNKKEATQPIPPDVAEALRQYAAGKDPTQPLWPGTWADVAADMLRLDLDAAGIPFETERGFADFHALRHSYLSLLAKSGVHPKLAQELARHSDIRLTMNVYTHAELDAKAEAVASLPSLLPKVASAP